MDDSRRRFEALALPHLDAAYNLACWLTRSRADADDVVQEAMVRAFKSFGGFRGENMRPWLLAIVRNCHLTALRQSRSRKELSLTDKDADATVSGIASKEASPEEKTVAADNARTLEKILSELPQDFREVLVLREVEDLSYREIAEIVGVPIGTVMSRLARARGLLRTGWLGQGGGSD